MRSVTPARQTDAEGHVHVEETAAAKAAKVGRLPSRRSVGRSVGQSVWQAPHISDQKPTAFFAAEGVVRHKPSGTEAALMTFADSRQAR